MQSWRDQSDIRPGRRLVLCGTRVAPAFVPGYQLSHDYCSVLLFIAAPQGSSMLSLPLLLFPALISPAALTTAVAYPRILHTIIPLPTLTSALGPSSPPLLGASLFLRLQPPALSLSSPPAPNKPIFQQARESWRSNQRTRQPAASFSSRHNFCRT